MKKALMLLISIVISCTGSGCSFLDGFEESLNSVPESMEDIAYDLTTSYYTPSGDDFAYAENGYGEIAIMGINPEITGNISIPDTINGKPVKVINNGAFYLCDNITGIKIPDTVIEIRDNAFYGCSNLKSIALPNGITEIPQYAFLIALH